MEAKEIYQELNSKSLNATRIAEVLKVRPQTVSNVIRDGYGSLRIAKAVSLAIDLPLEKVFPFYGEIKNRGKQKALLISSLSSKLSALV